MSMSGEDNGDYNPSSSKGPLFNGTQDYATWKSDVRAKAAFIDDPLKRVRYLFGLLRQPATDVALLGKTLDEDAVGPPFTVPSELYRALELVYGATDEGAADIATARLVTMYQGRRELNEFLQDFLSTCRTAGQSNRQALAMLIPKISKRLQPTLLNIATGSTISVATERLRMADLFLPKEKAVPAPQTPRQPTKKSKARGATTDKRDASGVTCHQCNKKGHFKVDCTEKPKARKATDKKTSTDEPDIEELSGEE